MSQSLLRPQRYFPGHAPELPQTARRVVRDVVEDNLSTAGQLLNGAVQPQAGNQDISFPSTAGAMSDDVWRGEVRSANGAVDEFRR